MACSDGDPRRRSGLTNPYQDPCSLSETGWWIWFGPVRHYHRLPIRTCKQHGGFGLVTPPITNPYHAADLGAGLPRVTFTNLYHRDEGLGDTEHIVSGIRHPVAGWRW